MGDCATCTLCSAHVFVFVLSFLGPERRCGGLGWSKGGGGLTYVSTINLQHALGGKHACTAAASHLWLCCS